MKKARIRTNRFITVREVFLIDDSGVSIGVCPTSRAMAMAQDKGLDLVEVSPNATPPVCKLLDFGKYKYQMNKKNKNQKKRQVLKEIRMQPKISDHDLKFKTNHVQQFLEEGHRVKVTIRFRGRELSHTELGEVVLRRILDMLDTGFSIDKEPSMEGRTMTMLLSPSSKKSNKKQPSEQDGKDTPNDATSKQPSSPQVAVPSANNSAPPSQTEQS